MKNTFDTRFFTTTKIDPRVGGLPKEIDHHLNLNIEDNGTGSLVYERLSNGVSQAIEEFPFIIRNGNILVFTKDPLNLLNEAFSEHWTHAFIHNSGFIIEAHPEIPTRPGFLQVHPLSKFDKIHNGKFVDAVPSCPQCHNDLVSDICYICKHREPAELTKSFIETVNKIYADKNFFETLNGEAPSIIEKLATEEIAYDSLTFKGFVIVQSAINDYWSAC